MKRFLRHTFFLTALLASVLLARAGVSYDESSVFAFDTRDYLGGLAAESATFAFDTRAMDGLIGSAVSGVFVLNTSFASAPPLNIAGTVRDGASLPLVGAVVALKRYETVFWQGTSGGAGTFSAPNLSPWNYTVVVTKAGYVTHVSSHTGSAGGGQTLNIVLQALPTPLTTQTIIRTPTAAEIGRPEPTPFTVPKLMRYDTATGQFTETLTGLDPSRMTVVISHGW